MRSKSGMGFADGGQVAQQAAMINNLLASGMTMADIKQYLGDEIGAIGAPPPQMEQAPAPVPQPQAAPSPVAQAGQIYGGGPSADAQALLGQIQGRADGGMIGDRDIVIDGRFYSSHVPEIQGFGMGEWLVRQTNPELAAQGDLAESFAAQEALTADTYAGDPAAMQESREHIPGLPVPEIGGWGAPEFVHEEKPTGVPLATVEAPPSPFPGFGSPGEFIRDQEAARAQAAASHPEEAQALLAAQDALREGPQGAELPGDVQAAQRLGEQVMKDLDPMYEVKKQKAAAEAMTQKLEAEQKVNEEALIQLGASDSQVVQGAGAPADPNKAAALGREANDPSANADAASIDAADKAPPEEKKGWLASVGQAFKTAFGELADPNSLATAAIVYGANLALGYDDATAGEQALSFYKKGLEEKQAQEAAVAKRIAEREDYEFKEGVKQSDRFELEDHKSRNRMLEAASKERIKAPAEARKLQQQNWEKGRAWADKTSKELLDNIGSEYVRGADGRERKQRLITATSSSIGSQYQKFMKDVGVH